MESTDRRRKGKPRPCACLCMQVRAAFSITIYNTINYRGSQASAPHRFLLISPSFPSSFTFPLAAGHSFLVPNTFWMLQTRFFLLWDSFLLEFLFTEESRYCEDLWNLQLKTFSLAVQRGCLRVLPTCIGATQICTRLEREVMSENPKRISETTN